MATKVQFDYANRLIIPIIAPDGNGRITLNVQTDIYSDGKEDWLSDPNLNKFRFPVVPIGGQTTAIGKLGTTFLLDHGWHIRPYEANHEFLIQGNILTSDGSALIVDTIGTHAVNVVQQLSTLVELRDSGASQALIDQVAGLSTDIDTLEATNAGLATNIGNLETTHSALVTEVNDLGLDVEDLVTTTQDLVTEVNAVSTEVVGLKTTNDALVIQVSDLETTVDLTNLDLEILRKVLTNRKVTDPNTGVITVYDDDDTVLFTAAIYEDAAGTIPYKGQGLERQDKLS